MKIVRVTNARTGQEVGSEIEVADRWWRRAVGLLGRDALAAGAGLLLEPCGSVHTVGMRLAIDVAFLDDDGRVVSTRPSLDPGRIAVGGSAARAALELEAGTLAHTGTRPGDNLRIEERP
jgi:uncharacterized membrane protein (UPF0127 family)